jgi:hypothetical protein
MLILQGEGGRMPAKFPVIHEKKLGHKITGQ